MDRFEKYDAVVLASFSQFYLKTRPGRPESGIFGDTALAFVVGPGQIMLSSPIQDGALAVAVRVFDRRPELLDESWNDVVEISFRAGSATTLTGWDPSDEGTPLPLVDDSTYRLRYAIASIDVPVERHVEVGESEEPFADLVRIDLWPSELENATLMVQRSRGGRNQVVSHALGNLRSEIRSRRADSTEIERFTEFADRAFAMFPELVQTTVDDGGKLLANTALVLIDLPGLDEVKAAAALSYADQRTARETRSGGIAHLLVQRALLSKQTSA